MNIVKPRRLRRGDLVGLLAPASAPSSLEKVEKGVRYLEQLGYRVRVGKHVMREHGYLAGTDQERVEDLNSMLRDRDIRAVIAIRGGYGTPRLLGLIDYKAVRKDPKIIVGYSDLTALQLALYRTTGLVTFSGPMSGVEMWNGIDPYTEENFWRLLTSPRAAGLLVNPEDEPVEVLKKGRGKGRLLGGCFSLVASLMGTPYFPDLRKAILILEDVEEAPHRVDRMLAQLFNAGILTRLSGLAFGRFVDCVPSEPDKPHLTIEQVISEVSGRVKCPVLNKVQYGHIPKKLTIPLGVRAGLDSRNEALQILEGAVT